MNNEIKITDFNYSLPEERIAKFPLQERSASKLLVYQRGEITDCSFAQLGEVLPAESLLVFNNTKVIRARLIFHKATGGRIEVFCLEPHTPADYERAFAVRGECSWSCLVGNLKKWKEELYIDFPWQGRAHRLTARRGERIGNKQFVNFEWDADLTFGQLLETLGRIPIPPYLCRESTEADNSRYQTVYSQFEGSVAAPTAGLHFTPELMDALREAGHMEQFVTLHVGAGTFLPVKSESATDHPMHTEHMEVTLSMVRALVRALGHITAVGTTSVRTLESLSALGFRVLKTGSPDSDREVDQWELYEIPAAHTGAELLTALGDYMERRGITKLKAATRIMIMPGYRFRVVSNLITNFHQPKSTLLLLVSAFVGGDWACIYDYALAHKFRFLSYGDSSFLRGVHTL